jgi:hypothetical protein
MWGWVAAPEENRNGEWAMPKGSGSSLRGRGNGPSGARLPPAWVGKPRSISAGSV